jgi:hypothetical protein
MVLHHNYHGCIVFRQSQILLGLKKNNAQLGMILTLKIMQVLALIGNAQIRTILN